MKVQTGGLVLLTQHLAVPNVMFEVLIYILKLTLKLKEVRKLKRASSSLHTNNNNTVISMTFVRGVE